jgi:hypothetical protein
MRAHIFGLASTLACLWFPLATRANDIEPGKEFYTVRYAQNPIVVDGDLSEWAGVPVLADPKFAVPKFSGTNANPNYVLFEEYAGGTWSGPDDLTSAVQIVYDSDNVYFGFVVTDDYHENISGNAWNGDSIQLMISDATRTTQVALYNYALGGYEDNSGTLITNDSSGNSYGGVIVNHEAGPQCITDGTCLTTAVITRNHATHKTIYEIKLPKEALGLTILKGGVQFGLGMAINDGDGALVDGVQYGEAGQEGQKGWGGLGAHAIVFGKTPSECALITLAQRNDIEPTKEYYTALRITNNVVIDGQLNEWTGVPVLADPKFAVPKYSGTNDNPNYVLFEEYAGGTWSGPDDLTSAVQIAYDADNVYFGFVVTDDYHENISGNAWNGDSIQLMIADAARTNQVALYNYALGGYEDNSGNLVTNDPSFTGGVITNHEAGPQCITDGTCLTDAVVTRNGATHKTIYEIRLPAAAVGLTPPLTAGMQFGLGMAINDGDGAMVNGVQYGQAGQEGQKGWGGLGAHSIVFGKTPSETALITLGTTVSGGDLLFLSSINPGVASFTFRATDKGSSIVDPNSAKLTIDNQVVALTASPKVVDATDFKYLPASPFPPSSEHTYIILVKDTLGNSVTAQGTFKTVNYSLDKLHGYIAEILGSATLTPDKGGHTGQAGDTALDFGVSSGTPASGLVEDATFLNPTSSNDVMTVSLWVKKYDNDGVNSAFWIESASSPGNLGFQASITSPDLTTGDQVIVMDVGGTDPDGEISASISTFPGFTGDSWWTNQWHNWVFVKNGTDKQIWIDGQMFLEGSGATPVPTDFTKLWLGAAGGGQGGTLLNLHGLIDDFALFGTALTNAQIQQIFSGTPPSALPASTKPLAFWDFSAPAPIVTRPSLTITKTGTSITISWPASTGFSLWSAPAITGPFAAVPGVTGNSYTITNPTGSAFYRLQQ